MELLAQVTLHSSIGELSAPAWSVESSVRAGDVLETLRRQPDRAGVVVVDRARIVAVFSRVRFFDLFSRPYFRELFVRRPLARLIATNRSDALQLPAETSVANACRAALGRPRELVGEPICVLHGRDDVHLLDLWQLLLAQSRQLELAQEVVLQEKQEAVRVARLKSEFLANTSHEIRTPMNGVIGMTEALLETPLTAEQREVAETLRSSSQSLLAVVNDVLDLSKLEAGKTAVETIDFDLRRLLEDAVGAMKAAARRKSIELVLVLDEALPRAVAGDPGRLRQVVGNLVGNAVKFTSVGRVTVSASTVGGDANVAVVRIEVRDSGIGIDPAARRLLFQPFSQVDGSTTRRFGGTGLGLAIAKQLVQLMDGEIDFTSELGQGSTFWFTVQLERRAALVEPTAGRSPCEVVEPLEPLAPLAPTSTPSAPTLAIATAVDAAPTPASGARRGHVLLAEDGPVNQKVATGLLRRLGMTFDVVADGRAAVDAVTKRRYDVVLMDCQMPELDGYDATRAIRRLDGVAATVPIVAMTANAMPGDRERCLAAGMDDYVSKPVSKVALEEALRRALGGARNAESTPVR